MKNHAVKDSSLTELTTAHFRFYGTLNDFLPLHKKKKIFKHTVKGHPSIKDTIEALRVPHPEVDCIAVNNKSVGFDYLSLFT